MWNKVVFGILFLGVWLISAGCSGPAIQVAQAEPVLNTRGGTSLEMRNCGAKTDLHRSLTTEWQVASQVEIAAEAVSTRTGETLPLPADVKTELEEQVRQTYQTVFEEAEASTAQEEFVVPADRARVFKISVNEQKFSSMISFRLGGKPYEASYTYWLEIPEITGYSETACTA